MALIYIDGFDKYGPTGQNAPTIATLMGQRYTMGSAACTIVASLNSISGYACSFSGGTNASITKGFGANYSPIMGGMRFQVPTLGTSVVPLSLMKGSTAQCSITVATDGSVSLRTGGRAGTALATSAAATIAAGSTHTLAWNITIGSSAAYTVYLDGVSLLSGTGNTRGDATNNNCDGFQILGLNAANLIIDDLFFNDNTGSYNNAVILTNPVVVTQSPNSDSQTQWTNAGNVLVPAGLAQTGVGNVSSTTNAPGANQLALIKVTPAANCTLNSVYLLPGASSATAKFKAVLYSDSAGAPNTLTATGNEITGATSGTALNLTFASGQNLTGGTSYWIGYITDTSVALSQYDATTNLGQKKSNTYGSGAPAGPLSGMTTGVPSWEIWGACTGSTVDYQSVAQNPAGGAGPSADQGTITSSTVNNEDLFGFPALPVAVNTVYGMQVNVLAKKSDAGSRTMDLRVSSSGTDDPGSSAGQAPGTTYGWLQSVFDHDPHGPAAWTTTSANAATAGPKIAA